MAAAELYTIALNVARDLPAAHRLTKTFRHARFKSAVDRFVSALYQVDTAALTDDDYSTVERATQIVANAVEIHMLVACDTTDCQILSESLRRLRAALEGLEHGLAIDPAKRPAKDALLDSLARELEKLDLQSLSPQIPLLRR